MLTFTLRRIASGIILLAVVSLLTFLLAHTAIPDPTQGLLGDSATPDQRAQLRTELGLERPLTVQLWDWFSHAIVGDFGSSWRYDRDVLSEVLGRLPVTLSVVSYAMVLSIAAGTAIGLASGLRPGSKLDRALGSGAIVLFALPGFWISLVLIIWFAVQLRWFPAVGYVEAQESLFGWLRSVTLPALALATGGTVTIAQQLRNAVERVGEQDYVRTLRSRGLSNRTVALHILRNAAPPALTTVALQFVNLLGGAIVVEAVFALPGLGQITNDASKIGDIPVLLGITVISVVFVVIVNLLLDLLLGLLNPKARRS